MSKSHKTPETRLRVSADSRAASVEFERLDTCSKSNKKRVPSEILRAGSIASAAAAGDPKGQDWCYPAFFLERALEPRERTDWDFVAPVWIAITLFCLLVQILAFRAFASFFY